MVQLVSLTDFIFVLSDGNSRFVFFSTNGYLVVAVQFWFSVDLMLIAFWFQWHDLVLLMFFYLQIRLGDMLWIKRGWGWGSPRWLIREKKKTSRLLGFLQFQKNLSKTFSNSNFRSMISETCFWNILTQIHETYYKAVLRVVLRILSLVLEEI